MLDGPVGITPLTSIATSEDCTSPYLVSTRDRLEASTAIVFLHGLGGNATETWGRFPEFIERESSLASWDIHSIGYATSLRVDVPLIWAADPPLRRLSLSLKSALNTPPLGRYKSIAIIAHSMGGLVAQHAMLDRPTAARVGHVILFGTPSAGLYKAALGAVLKRQTRDVFALSPFILLLRLRWWLRFRTHAPFELRAVAGERDEFVGPRSSLRPFPEYLQRVVPGNHVEIVKPHESSSRSVQIVVDAICGDKRTSAQIKIDSAVTAVERREFETAIATLLPRERAGERIDDIARVALALALESVGRSQEAFAVLESPLATSPSSDVQGVLGGRLKRRWLVDRVDEDWRLACERYQEGLNRSDPDDLARTAKVESESALIAGTRAEDGQLLRLDASQAMYHAINLAFLEAMHSPSTSTPPKEAQEFARRTLWYAGRAKQDHWNAASRGDAHAILNKLDTACECYSNARQLAARPREIDSMYSQAVRIAEQVHGAAGVGRVIQAFGMTEVDL